MGQWPGWFFFLDAAVDTGCLKQADQNGEFTVAFHFAKEDDLLVVDLTDNDAGQFHLNEHNQDCQAEVRMARHGPARRDQAGCLAKSMYKGQSVELTADPPRPSAGPGGIIGLANMERVQKELGIDKDEAKIEEIRKLAERTMRESREQFGNANGERREGVDVQRQRESDLKNY